MTNDEAKVYLTDLFKPEYHRYINTKLASDFAVTLVKKFEEKNKRMILDIIDDSFYNTTDGWLFRKWLERKQNKK